jgi:5,5'-dehydrodivanillate O-demethylase
MNAPVEAVAVQPSRPLKQLSDFYNVFPHTGLGTLAGRYMRQFWHPVALSRDIEAGRAKPIMLMSEKFTLFRGDTGTAHVLPHHCPHRGTQLSVGCIEGDNIRCLYHGWAFDGHSGQCVEMPAEDPGQAEKLCIRHYPVQEYLGLIWTYIGEGEAPPFPRIPAFDTEGTVHANTEPFAHNFFQCWENDFDIFHAAYTRRTGGLHQIDFKSMLESEVYEEKDFGVERHIDTGGQGIMVSTLIMPCTLRLSIPLVNEEARMTGRPMIVPTYLIHSPVDDHNNRFFLVRDIPLVGAEFDRFVANSESMKERRRQRPDILAVAADIRVGKYALKDVTDHPAFILIEDLCAQGGQGFVAERHAEHLGKSDRGIMMLRRIWARELAALHEGRPTKAWTRPSTLPRGTFGENKPK